MAEHVWTFLCRRALIDRDTLLASAFDLVQAITVSEEDATQDPDIGYIIEFPMQLFSWWVRSEWSVPESTTARLRILLPTGEHFPIRTLTGEESFFVPLMQSTGVRPKIQLPGVPWAGLGVYWFLLEEQVDEKEWRTAARIPVELKGKEKKEAE